jgi:hypothetical protein
MGEDGRIDELLAKLVELDPETYQHFREICAMTAFDYSFIDEPGITTPVYGWCLQGVIQGAVAARRWHFDVCYNEETKKYVSLVAPPDNETWLDSIEAATPAEALLATYIQALEAEVAHGSE